MSGLICTAAQARLLALVEETDTSIQVGDDGGIHRSIRGYPDCWAGYPPVRCATVRVTVRRGWIDRDGENVATLTEDGVIALGFWRERKLKALPFVLPDLTGREREIVELAQRALELGYALCARRPARGEARRMRRVGWFTDCWVANAASGLVPTPLALVEIRPDDVDRPLELPS